MAEVEQQQPNQLAAVVDAALEANDKAKAVCCHLDKDKGAQAADGSEQPSSEECCKAKLDASADTCCPSNGTEKCC